MTVKKVLVIVGYVGTLIGSFFIGEAIGAYYWNKIIAPTFGVDEI